MLLDKITTVVLKTRGHEDSRTLNTFMIQHTTTKKIAHWYSLH